MSKLAGVNGAAHINDVEIKVTNWSYSGAKELPEVTEIGDTYKTYHPTTRSGSGSLTFILDPTVWQQRTLIDQLKTGVTDAKIDVKLQYDDTGNKMVHFSAWVVGVELPDEANGVIATTLNFTQDGDLFDVPVSTATSS